MTTQTLLAPLPLAAAALGAPAGTATPYVLRPALRVVDVPFARRPVIGLAGPADIRTTLLRSLLLRPA